jgi:hypothetical protein
MVSESSYGTRRAINELLAIFSCQWANGMLPQIRFMPGQHGYRPDADDWGVTEAISGPTALRTSGITQPPIMGLCAWEVFRKIGPDAQAAHAADFRTIAAGLERFHDWLFRERDPWHEHLVLCLHPWETGTDNSPAFDRLIDSTRAYIEQSGLPVETFGRADTVHVAAAHRPTARDYYAYFGLMALFKKHHYDQQAIIAESPFLLQDVLFNSLLAVSLRALAQLEEALAEQGGADAGALRDQANRNRERTAAMAGAMRDKFWDIADAFFYSYDSRGKRQLPIPTVSGFMPLLAEIADADQARRLLEHLHDPEEFASPVPIPSTALDSPVFSSERYWSGPSWPVTNWLVVRGLRERGEAGADALRLSTLAMIAEGTDPATVRVAAMGVMELNSFDDHFTTPSSRQYAHAWLWDSAIVAVSWPSVVARPPGYQRQDGDPGFWEYYEPHTGAPLGAKPMTWTASLFVELQDMGED